MIRRNRTFAKPFDLGHSVLYNNFPREYTKTIGVPGEFVKKVNTRVHLKDGTDGEMDSAYIADPDFIELFERAVVCLEHLSIPLGDSKLYKIGDYDIQVVSDEHLPSLIVIACHEDKEKSKNVLQRTPSDITKLYFLDLGKENICKRLNTVRKKINNNECLTTIDALNLGVIALYAPRENACEITEEVVELYLKIVNDLDLKMEFTLYSVITMMIDAFFDDEKEYVRLINMIDENTSVESKDQFDAVKNLQGRLDFAYERLDSANQKLDSTTQELNSTTQELNSANQKLDSTALELKNANGKISELESEVKELKAQLNAK